MSERMGLLDSWRAYREFQSRPESWRDIVFYAETHQDWHHFEGIIRELTERLGRSIAYLTSDPSDPVLARAGERFHAFYLPAGWPTILAFQTLRARVLVLTMMDLGNLQLKRSLAQPVHYVYVFHSLGSTHMVDLPGSYDQYDTILCAGPHQLREIRRREELEGLPRKQLIAHGYARIESLIERADGASALPHDAQRPTVLIAPTWGEHALLEVCGELLIDLLIAADVRVILRPHYETVRRSPRLVQRLVSCFSTHPRFEYVDAMAESETLLRSDLLICDWSAMAIEYALALGRPVLFIDVSPRIRNPEYAKLGVEPIERSIRHQVGEILSVAQLVRAPDCIRRLLAQTSSNVVRLSRLRDEVVYNLGRSARVGAEAIDRIAEPQRPRAAARVDAA